MRLFVRCLPAFAFAVVAATPVSPPAAPRGFFADGAAAEHESERELRAIPDPAVARETMRHLAESRRTTSARAQGGRTPSGSWRSSGSSAWTRRSRPSRSSFPRPRARPRARRALEVPRRARRDAARRTIRPPRRRPQQLPTYNAYSADGEATAPLVYVNYGIPADYEVLERLGVDVRGKIVIARYGGGWRGIKPKVAAEKGARRLHHLLGPERRRLLPGRGVPGRPVPARAGRPARKRRGHAALLRATR